MGPAGLFRLPLLGLGFLVGPVRLVGPAGLVRLADLVRQDLPECPGSPGGLATLVCPGDQWDPEDPDSLAGLVGPVVLAPPEHPEDQLDPEYPGALEVLVGPAGLAAEDKAAEDTIVWGGIVVDTPYNMDSWPFSITRL